MGSFVLELQEVINRHVVASSHRSDRHGQNLEYMAVVLHEAGDKVAELAQRWLESDDDAA